MDRRIPKTYFVAALLVIVFIAGSLFLFNPFANSSEAPAGTIALQAPSFIQKAHAEGASPAANFLEEEAGISAYMKSPYAINLNNVRDLFRTIEDETSDYIIGSMHVADNPEDKDVHVYINKNGWIVAYYLRGDPVGKVLNWPKYHNNGRTSMTTMLEDTIAYITSEASLPYSGVTYYHFRYPHATKMMIIIENARNKADSFEVNLTSSYNYFERSWSLYSTEYKLNGETIENSSDQKYGIFTATQLPPDVQHTITIDTYEWGYGALVLVYWRP